MDYQIVILAAGESSRFYPFNDLHKGFFVLGGKTILEHTVENIRKATSAEIILVLGRKNFEIEKQICSDSPILRNIKIVCEEQPLGESDAILSAEKFLGKNFFVINTQQINFGLLVEDFLREHTSKNNTATVAITKTDHPERYGIVSLSGRKITGIVEKPEKGTEPSDKRMVGIYLLSNSFLHELKKIKQSKYSFEAALNLVAQEEKVGFIEPQCEMPSLKYPWEVLSMKEFIFSGIDFGVDKTAVIEKTALLKGDNIFIGKNAHVYDFAMIEGPAYIGDNAVVGTYCQVRGGTILEKNSQVERYTDVKNSVIGEGTHVHSGFIGDSIIGKNDRIGAGFITANKRLDRNSVKVVVEKQKVDSGRTSLGVLIGDNVNVGVQVSTMPGSVVGANSIVYPSAIVKGFYEPRSDIVK